MSEFTEEEVDGIEMTLRSYANLIVQPTAYIDLSHLTDAEWDAFVAENFPEPAHQDSARPVSGETPT